MKKEKYDITGMTCSACSSRVEKCVAGLNGMDTVSVNLLTNSMQVTYEEDKLDADKIIEAVEHAGYGASVKDGHNGYGTAGRSEHASAYSQTGQYPGNGTGSLQTASHEPDSHDGRKKSANTELQKMKQRLIWSFVFLIPMMYISMHHMLYEWFGIPVPAFIKAAFHGDENALAFSFAQFLLLLPILYLNQKYFIIGFKNIFVHRSPNMDSLIALGSAASAVYGIFAIFRIGYGLGHQDMELVARYSMDIYFESAGMILTLITLGKYLETRSKGRTSEAIEKLMDLAPKQARVERNETEYMIPVEEVVLGDVVLVKPGEAVPVDGTILEGRTSLDESALTGESIPVYRQPGEEVISASMNQSGLIKIRAGKVGEDTTISQIIRLVEEASSSKAPIAKLADKISGIFVPVVIVIALAAVVIWFLSGAGFEFALSTGIAVLVISCPCALGLATPVAIMVGTGKGAEHGILIKSGEALETAHSIDTVVMDKTGTITEGKPRVTDIHTFSMTEKQLLMVAAGIEQGSEHPLAQAVMDYARENNITPAVFSDFETVSGRGILAKQQDTVYFAGNEAFLQENGISLSGEKAQLEQFAAEGKTPLLFAGKDRVIGLIAVADTEKPTSRQAIEAFHNMHIDVVMLTGDHEQTAQAIGKRLGISHVIAQVMPQDKERHIAKLQEQGHKVAMIGDGINDSPALAKADVGIAIGAGTDIAIESADAVLMRNDLMDAVTAIRLSKAVIRNIKENLFWAFFYNSIGIPLAAGVLYPAFGLKLNPMFGAAAMSLSSVCVVSNALRLKLFRTEQEKSDKMTKREKIYTAESNKKESNENQEGNGMKAELKIEGMMCEHCKKYILDALNAIEGATAEVNLEQKSAVVIMTQEIPDNTFKRVIQDAGYECTQITRL